MEISVLNAGAGDYKAEFDADDESAREQMGEFIADMLTKGYALFLEDGDETHRVTGYDAKAQTFTVVSSKERKGRAVIRVAEDKADALVDTSGAPLRKPRRKRMTAVAQSAGG